MSGVAEELVRGAGPCAADVLDGEVVVVAVEDRTVPTRRRMVFARGTAAPRDVVVEPGTATFVHADAHGTVVVGGDLTLIDARGPRRLDVALGGPPRVGASGRWVAGFVSERGGGAVVVVSRQSGAVLRVPLGAVDLTSLAVTDSHVAWVEREDDGQVHLADLGRRGERSVVAIRRPRQVSAVGGALYITHGGNLKEHVLRWSGDALTPVGPKISSLARIQGRDEPLALLPAAAWSDPDGARRELPPRLVALSEPDAVLYRGPTAPPDVHYLDQPAIVGISAHAGVAVVVERRSRADFRVFRVPLPPPARTSPPPPPSSRTPVDRRIEELELDPEFQDALHAAGIERMGELTRHSRAELLRIGGLGHAGVDQIEEHLGDFDLTLRSGG